MGTDSKPEAWRTSAHGAWSTLDKGVAIETVPGQRGLHRITWPGGEELIEGHDAAVAFAHRKVAELETSAAGQTAAG
jgi:hypothetical protein